MFAPDDSREGETPEEFNAESFPLPVELNGGHEMDFSVVRQYLPLVNTIVAELSENLPVECDRQEVMSVGTVALARALNDFVDKGLGSFEEYARVQIRRAIGMEFVGVPQSSPPVGETIEGEAEVDLTGRKILIVEDSPMIRRKLRFLLERAKFEVFEAKSGEEGIWLSQECLPDLVLLDVVMDRMDGFETCERMKALPEFADIPIVFLTGKTETQFIARGFQVGASDYIAKPFNPHEALPRIRTHLKVRVLSAFRQRNIAELQKLNQAKDKLLRMASHDLRNPLSAIHGLSDLLKTGAVGRLSHDQGEIVETIHSAAGSMMVMLSDLLDLSSLESDSVRLNIADENPVTMVQTLVNLFRVQASKKGIDLQMENRGGPTRLGMDAMQVRRVLENFLSNAIKFSPSGTVVRLVLSQNDTSCFFDVEDEGPGVLADEQKLLFKEFSRTSNRPTAGEKSTGLGLSICRRIALAHQGDVSMTNLQPRGARFRFELPLKPVESTGGRHRRRSDEESTLDTFR